MSVALLVPGVAVVIALALRWGVWPPPGDVPGRAGALPRASGPDAGLVDQAAGAAALPAQPLARTGLGQVLVLRLQRAAGRASGLQDDARALGVPLDFIDSTDAYLNESFRSRLLPLHQPEGTCADFIGAIFDSHERAWQRAAAGGLPALVLEDDVRLPPDFVEVLTERMAALPQGYHLAMAGTSVTPAAARISPLLSQPDSNDPDNQALLGFWAYVVSPGGAQQLLHLVRQARDGSRRLFQPVDLFVAHRLRSLKVFVLEPTRGLALEFRRRPDPHHVIGSMRQVGIVTLSHDPSTNKPAEDEESARMQQALEEVNQLGESGEFLKSWRKAKWALRSMRRYSCWNAATLLQSGGLSMLRLLQTRSEGAPKLGGANGTLLVALEAFASAARYNQGTWMERKKRKETPSWVRYALHHRARNGFPDVSPPGGWDARLPLPGGGWLDAGLPPELVAPLQEI